MLADCLYFQLKRSYTFTWVDTFRDCRVLSYRCISTSGDARDRSEPATERMVVTSFQTARRAVPCGEMAPAI